MFHGRFQSTEFLRQNIFYLPSTAVYQCLISKSRTTYIAYIDLIAGSPPIYRGRTGYQSLTVKSRIEVDVGFYDTLNLGLKGGISGL